MGCVQSVNSIHSIQYDNNTIKRKKTIKKKIWESLSQTVEAGNKVEKTFSAL
jgi:hypothetical protein